MHAIASVTSVTSPSRRASVERVVKTSNLVQPATTAKAGGSVRSTPNLSAAQNTATGADPNLPLGLLMAAGRPSMNNTEATADYQDLQSALRFGNLAVAQQAYVRLQSDVLLAQSAPAAVGATATDATAVLNATA